jgi:DDE superfamily endonuclease
MSELFHSFLNGSRESQLLCVQLLMIDFLVVASRDLHVKGERAFRSLFGGPPDAYSYLWSLICSCHPPCSLVNPISFLTTLNFMKDPGSSWFTSAFRWKIDPRTLEQQIKTICRLIYDVLPEVLMTSFLSFNKFLFFCQFSEDDLLGTCEGWSEKAPPGIIDCFKCRIEQPKEESWEFLTQANVFHIKYEVVCSVLETRFVWISGPWKGAARDDTISKMSGVKETLKGDLLLGDKIYKGDKKNFICPLPGHRYHMLQDERAFNYLVYSARQTIERMIGRMKKFGVLNCVWRYPYSLHELITKAIAKLVNLFIIFEPMDKEK